MCASGTEEEDQGEEGDEGTANSRHRQQHGDSLALSPSLPSLCICVCACACVCDCVCHLFG